MSLAGARVTGQVVSGMQVAWAWSAASVWNVGRRETTLRPAGKLGRGARGSVPSSRNCEALSTVAAAPADRFVVVVKLL